MSNLEQTLSIIKPDAVERDLSEEIKLKITNSWSWLILDSASIDLFEIFSFSIISESIESDTDSIFTLSSPEFDIFLIYKNTINKKNNTAEPIT